MTFPESDDKPFCIVHAYYLYTRAKFSTLNHAYLHSRWPSGVTAELANINEFEDDIMHTFGVVCSCS